MLFVKNCQATIPKWSFENLANMELALKGDRNDGGLQSCGGALSPPHLTTGWRTI
jgi:hypothetical protein